MSSASFRSLFERWSRRVRARLLLRHALTGAAVGLLVGAGASAWLWKTRHGTLRPAGAAIGLLGAAAGLAIARRRRWPDTHVALYLDARLGTDEAIATAVELDARPAGDAGASSAVVLSQASVALAGATRRAVATPILRPSHAVLPAAAAALGWITLAPLPPLPRGSGAAPGADKVQILAASGLEKVIKLGQANARDEAQRERLKKLADEAAKLREKLRAGVEKREAQAEIGRLRDEISAERLSLGEGEQRQGMESALGKLGENPDLKNAQKALGDRDLVRLDEEMERLANRQEKADRERALKTLEEAAEAAKQNGAPDVAKALLAEKKRLAELGKKADHLRELARELGNTLGEEGRQALEDFNRSGSGKDAQKLSEKLNEVLDKLSPEERKRLAENLKKRIKEAPESAMGPGQDKDDLKDLVDQLSTPEGLKRLEDELREMAKAPPPGSEEGERQRGLDDAEDGAGETERQLGGGGVPIPLPMPGGPGKGGPQGGGDDKGSPIAGHTEGGGPGGHKGMTGVVEGGEMRAHASARMNKGTPMPGVVMGRTAGKAGETANVQGVGALGQAAAGEIGGVERSDVPEEYREQVGRYFQPR